MQDRFVAVKGKKLQAAVAGEGPPLVLLSGSSVLFPTLEYAPLASILTGAYQVMIPAKFGYGMSDPTSERRDVDTVVEEHRAALAALGIAPPVVLAAHSMGFLEALRWAQEYPGEVLALVGLDPATPDVYQHFDAAGSLRQLERLSHPEWKRKLIFRLLARSLLARYPTSLRRSLKPAARRNFAGEVWLNEGRALLENAKTVARAGPPAQLPALFLLSNGKGTPLPKDQWRGHALQYLSHFETSRWVCYDHPHDLYRFQPQDQGKDILLFLSEVL